MAEIGGAAIACGLAYADKAGRIYFDPAAAPLADDGVVREAFAGELIPAPPGTVPALLPGRSPLLANGIDQPSRTALSALLPAGYTRLLVPAYVEPEGAPVLPLFGYTYACVIKDSLYVAAAKTDGSPDWAPRYFKPGELDRAIARRRAGDSRNAILKQIEICAREYGCFTAQNVFLEQGEAAIPVSPRCNAACVGCISEQEDGSGVPAPQVRIRSEMQLADIVALAVHHLERVGDGIISFGQGCEGEPLLRSTTIARAIELIRLRQVNGTINCNTNGSIPEALARLIDAGLGAVRISLNSFRPDVYAAYYRPTGYGLDDVLESIRLAVSSGLRVSLNLLTHPGVSDDRDELAALDEFLTETPVSMIQTRTLNIDPARYFAAVGRSLAPQGMLKLLEVVGAHGVRVGNFTSPE